MIVGPREQFITICNQRGYSLDEVVGCIIADDGTTITVDETHPSYPLHPKPGFSIVKNGIVIKYATTREQLISIQRASHKFGGPGTELKKLLKKFGIVPSPNCSCNARAQLMDEKEAQEPGWCESNLDTIVGWLKEEAKNRKMPFIDAVGRMLVRRAIKLSKKN